jgi:hypothetical protein
VGVSSAVSLAVYAGGAFIMSRLGLLWLTLYVLFILFLEIRLVRGHCVNCYYFGKVCAFGKGKLSGMLFKRGDMNEFIRNGISWKDMLPDLCVALVPLAAGTVLLAKRFDWLILSSMLLLIVLSSAGNGFVRSRLACAHCRQKELGCPAEKLFNKKRT